MEQLQEMKTKLINYVSGILNHVSLEECDTEELGEAIDMIKDLCEASYYCSITK